MSFRLSNYAPSEKIDFPFEQLFQSDEPVTSVRLVNDSLLYATSSNVFEAKENHDPKTLVKHKSKISSLAATPELIASGDVSGYIKLSNYDRTVMRSFTNHQAQVNKLQVAKNCIFSCSNDLQVCVNDFIGDKCVFSHKKHTDYVKSVCTLDNYVYSVGMDKRLIGVDLRSSDAIIDVQLDDILMDLVHKDAHSLIIAQKYELVDYDLRNLQTLKKRYIHTKEITNLRLLNGRIYTSSIDGFVKCYSDDFECLSKVNFEDPILDLDVLKSKMVVSLNDGSVYQNEIYNPTYEKPHQKFKRIKRYFDDEIHDDVQLAESRKKNQKNVEMLINNRQHYLAFSQVLKSKNFDEFYSCVLFINDCNGIPQVIRNRKASEVQDILDMVINYFHILELRTAFLNILDQLIISHAQMFVDIPEIYVKLQHLQQTLATECIFNQKSIQFLGFVESHNQ